jgi:hypothetical protein
LRIRIRGLFYPWIRDPEWEKKSGFGSGMNNLDHISESLEAWVKILNFFDTDPGSGVEKNRIRDGKKLDPG